MNGVYLVERLQNHRPELRVFPDPFAVLMWVTFLVLAVAFYLAGMVDFTNVNMFTEGGSVMPTYLVGMMKEQWIAYDAESPEQAKELAQSDYPYWTVVGANEA